MTPNLSDTKQLKTHGLSFGRTFQMAIRTSVMFGPNHPSLERPIEQSFTHLNELLKQLGQFTLGFVNNQVLINSLLTTDPNLAHLEKEFSKRGIAAFTFEAGLTLARYRHIITLLAAAPSVIEEAGGIRDFLDANAMEGGRIVAAPRKQKVDGDTLIATDSESYILSKQMVEDRPRDLMESLDALLESACLDPAIRASALAGWTPQHEDGDQPDYGVPLSIPSEIIEKGAGSKHQTGSDGGELNTQASAGGGKVAEPAQSPAGNVRAAQRSAGGGYRTFVEMVEDSINRSLTEELGNPRKSYLSLARILKDSSLDTVLSYFPPERRKELGTEAPEQLAAEYIEDTTLKLIGAKLTRVEDGQSGRAVVEEEVLRLLARSLQATQMADRLASKLAKFFQDFAVPSHLQNKIQEELRWTALSPRQKFSKLMEASRYDFTEFRRLQEFLKELTIQQETQKVLQLTTHYFAFLETEKVAVEPEELSRALELIRLSKIGREPETDTIVSCLTKVLLRQDVTEMIHFQAAHALATLSHPCSTYEAFDKVLGIGDILRQSANRIPDQHKKCCLDSLGRMIAPTAVDRLIELYMANRSDANMARTAAAILRHAAPAGPEGVLKQLANEKNANQRIALLRLISQIGPSCLDAARGFLQDERWYVVRNMCNLLAELRDPELVNHLELALRHPDERVQQAALNALIKTRAEGRAKLIATCLVDLAASVTDPALDELMFLRSDECVPGLRRFLLSQKTGVVVGKKALQILASTPGRAAQTALEELAVSGSTTVGIRQAAHAALQKREPKMEEVPAR